jgi:Mn-dependent DtxR family transcriptional regulator
MHESGEMYLETIYLLSQKKNSVRSIDVAEEMGFSKPSVSRGVSILRNGGFLDVDANGYLCLTDAGVEVAKKIYARHTLLTDLLIRLGVDSEIAAEDACKMEHVISDATFEALKKHVEEL